MSTTVASENKKLGEELVHQEQRNQDKKLSGKQEDHKIQNAQDVLKNLQIILGEGEMPGTELINDVLLKAEEFLLKTSQSAQIDPQTRKVLEDITLLIGSTKQMARNKDLGDRLQRIADETAKVVKDVNDQPGLTPETRTASLQVVKLVDTWRPLFELMCSSREFRMTLLDTVKLCRKTLNRHTKVGLGDKVEQQFVSGAPIKEIAKDVAQDTKETFKTPTGETQVRVADEEYEKLYEDCAHILMTLARTPSYHDGIDRLFNLFEIVRGELSETKSQVPENLQLHAKRAQLETEQLITAFTGQKPLDEFITSLKRLVEKMNQETKSKEYISNVRKFILDTKNADKIGEKETKEKLKKFASEGREIIDQFKYGNELDVFFEKSEQLVDSFMNDETVTVLRHHAGLVADDLSFVDDKGNVQLDTDMLSKLRGVIGPVVAETLKYIPIARIEDDNENTHFWVDKIVLCGYDIIPDCIRVQMESDNTINLRQIQTDHYHTSLIITLSNIKTEIKNLEFYYHKKTFPQLTEQGRATLRLPGDGASLRIKYYVKQTEGQVIPVFHQGKVDFQIHNFELDFDKKTLDHDILVPMITSLFKNQFQRRIEHSVETNLGGLVNSIGEKLTSALTQVNRPLMSGMEQVKKTIKSTEVGQIFDKRKDKLE